MEQLFTIREVAKYLKISESSLYRYVESGRLPHIKIGSNIRLSKNHITTFLERNFQSKRITTTYSPALAGLQAIQYQW